jgi:hypothetical protein
MAEAEMLVHLAEQGRALHLRVCERERERGKGKPFGFAWEEELEFGWELLFGVWLLGKVDPAQATVGVHLYWYQKHIKARVHSLR